MHTREDCNETRNLLHLFVGGDLEPSQMGQVEDHLDACASCALEERAARAAREAYRGALADGLVAIREERVDLWPGIRRRAVAEGLIPAAAATPRESELPEAPVLPGPRPAARILRLAGTLAAAALLLVAFRPELFPVDDGGPSAPAGSDELVETSTPRIPDDAVASTPTSDPATTRPESAAALNQRALRGTPVGTGGAAPHEETAAVVAVHEPPVALYGDPDAEIGDDEGLQRVHRPSLGEWIRARGGLPVTGATPAELQALLEQLAVPQQPANGAARPAGGRELR